MKFISLFLLALIPALACVSFPAQAIDMKVDRVVINSPLGGSAITWSAVTFAQSFGAVPVVIVLPTNSNAEPATLRIRNVSTTGFELGVVEPPGEDGQTAAMTVDYFAAETGVYTFAGSVRMVVGSYSTTTHQGRNVPGAAWDDVNFAIGFAAAPAVIATVQTINSQPGLEAGVLGNPFLTVAIDNVSSADMDMALERSETSTGTLVAETIGYVAMASGGNFTLSGETVVATLTPDNIAGWDNGCFTNNYAVSFSATPLVLATKNSRNGADGGWLRRCSVTTSNVGLAVDEDRAADTDRSHIQEMAGVFAISAAFHGQRNGRDIEAGSVTIPGTLQPTQWTSVAFPNAFSITPHVFALATDDGAAPAALRVRNVSVNGFDIAAVEPTGGNAAHSQMEVDYVAIIPGEHTLASGDVFEVGSIATASYQAGFGGSTGTENISFNASFSGGAAALLQIQSVNNEPALDPNAVSSPWLVTATTDLNSANMIVALDRTEAVSGSVSAPETLAYFTAQDGANDTLEATDFGVVDYEMFVTPDNILGFDDGCYNNNYSESYVSPYAIATQSSRDGNNGGWVRRCSVSSTQIGLTIDEDQANDSERTHTTEQASVFVFSRAFEAEFNTIDHYAIFHSSSGVTCDAETVIIAAHDASELGVEAGGRTITITATSSSAGWSPSDVTWTLSSGSGVLTTPSAGVAQYTFDTGESALELLFANTSEAIIDIDVVDVDPTLSDQDGVAEDPPLTFSDTGFRFYNDADGDGDADGTDPIASPLIAGIQSGQLILRGINTSSTTGACESRVSGPQSVNMAYECVDPLFCFRAGDLQIGGTPIGENDFGGVGNFQAVPLNFDADGEATFSLEYFDAGSIRLHAELFLPASGGDPAVTLSGASDVTTIRPYDLVITGITDNAGSANPGTTTSGSGFVASDATFTVTVEARNADGGTTPNFGAEIAAESITLRAMSVVMPAGGILPALSSADSFSATVTAGEFENTTVRWSEAGTITLRAEIRDGDYLGTGNVTGTTSGNVGRFYPDHFRLASSAVSNGCAGGFTYMSDQLFTYAPIDISYRIEAVTAGLSVLQNYQANYPVATLVVDAENADDGNNQIARFFLPSATWSGGGYRVSGTDNAGFARLLSGVNEVPDGPYTSLLLGIRTTGSNADPTDFLSADVSLNANTSGDCSASNSCTAVTLGGSLNLRFGRLLIANAHGPESAALNVPFESQYWDSTLGFVTNTADSCTIISMASIQFDGNALSTDSNRSVSIDSGTSTGTFDSFNPGMSMAFSAGDAGLSFSAPGAGNSGVFNVDVDLSNYPWLRSDWNSDGDAANDTELPGAEIQFGRYRGHDRIIYWNEVFD